MIERYEDILLREQKGILKWIVEGWKLYQKEGMKELPSAMQNALNEYAHECDALKQFIEERCVSQSEESRADCSVKLKDFTTAYNAWCKENSFRSSNARALAGELRAEGYEVTRGAHNQMIIRNIDNIVS